MSVLDHSIKDVIKVIEATGPDIQALLEEERGGKNRKSLIAWLENQDAQGSEAAGEGFESTPEAAPADASLPEVEPEVEPPTEPPKAPVAGVDSIEGGVFSVSELIDVLCQKRDSLQRSASCGLENIKVHLSDITISIS